MVQEAACLNCGAFSIHLPSLTFPYTHLQKKCTFTFIQFSWWPQLMGAHAHSGELEEEIHVLFNLFI